MMSAFTYFGPVRQDFVIRNDLCRRLSNKVVCTKRMMILRIPEFTPYPLMKTKGCEAVSQYELGVQETLSDC